MVVDAYMTSGRLFFLWYAFRRFGRRFDERCRDHGCAVYLVLSLASFRFPPSCYTLLHELIVVDIADYHLTVSLPCQLSFDRMVWIDRHPTVIDILLRSSMQGGPLRSVMSAILYDSVSL